MKQSFFIKESHSTNKVKVQRSVAKGRVEGRMLERKDMALTALQEGLSIKSVMKITKLSREILVELSQSLDDK